MKIIVFKEYGQNKNLEGLTERSLEEEGPTQVRPPKPLLHLLRDYEQQDHQIICSSRDPRGIASSHHQPAV